jgi:hypothetical protein
MRLSRARPCPPKSSQIGLDLLRIDRLALLEHRDEGRDLLLASRCGLHGERAKGQREPVLRRERLLLQTLFLVRGV